MRRHPSVLPGARPLARLLDETVKRPLTDELLFGRLQKGGSATIAVRDGEIAIVAEPAG